MHRLKVAISGTSKTVSKTPPNPQWAQADAVFNLLEAPALEVETTLRETSDAWTRVARLAADFSQAMLKVPTPGQTQQPDNTFAELTAELDSQVADAEVTMSSGLDRLRQSHEFLSRYCNKIRTLQDCRKMHEKAVTEAAYYREKVDKVRDTHLKRKKSTETELEKLKRNEDKLRAFDAQVKETEAMFISGVEFLVRNKAIVFDRVLVGYIVSQSAVMESNPFRGLSASVQADFSTILATPLHVIDLETTTGDVSGGLLVGPDPDPNIPLVAVEVDNGSHPPDTEHVAESVLMQSQTKFTQEPAGYLVSEVPFALTQGTPVSLEDEMLQVEREDIADLELSPGSDSGPSLNPAVNPGPDPGPDPGLEPGSGPDPGPDPGLEPGSGPEPGPTAGPGPVCGQVTSPELVTE